MLTKTGDYLTIPGIWYFDPEKYAEYDAALKDKNLKMEIGAKENKYWLDIKKQLEAKLQ